MEWTNAQVQTDTLVSKFSEEALDAKTILPLMAGGMAYRLGRIAVLSPQSLVLGQRLTPYLIRSASVAFGLASEISAFEFSQRFLKTMTRDDGRGTRDLWNWSGEGGWREGLATSALTFGFLRAAGFLAREQNIVLQHGFQSVSMVAGHQAASYFQLIPKAEGSLPEQLLNAEATNLQMAAGGSLLHGLLPSLSARQREIDLRVQGNLPLSWRLRNGSLRLHLAGESEGFEYLPTAYMSAGGEGGGGGRKNPSNVPETTADTPSDPIRTETLEVPEKSRGLSEEHPENLLARSIYQSIPAEARDIVDVNLLTHKDFPELKGQPLKILAFSLAETLNRANHLLSYHSRDLMPEKVQELHIARRWIIEHFDTLNRDPAQNPLWMRLPNLSSFSLHWIHEDFTASRHSRPEADFKMFERVPDASPFNSHLPWLVREIRKICGRYASGRNSSPFSPSEIRRAGSILRKKKVFLVNMCGPFNWVMRNAIPRAFLASDRIFCRCF